MPGSRIQGRKLICITGEIRLETNPLFCEFVCAKPPTSRISLTAATVISGDNQVSDASAAMGEILIGFKR